MNNLLQEAAAWLGQALQGPAGIEGVYVRGATQTGPIVGVPTQHEYEVVDDETQLPTKVVAYDWTFLAADLVIGGAPITPRKGDRWKPVVSGVEETYEVLPLGKRPAGERLDTSGVLILVHTKRVAA
jgi:hypothetical protein